MPKQPEVVERPTELAPAVELAGARVLTGTCSWTDPTLVKETDWYPERTMSPAERLAFYSARFPLVEADSTYYRPPDPSLSRGWVERTPPGFRMDVKAWSLLTHHPTKPATLWEDLREGVLPEFREKKNLYAEHLEPEALDEAWERVAAGLAPLEREGMLGAVLLQYPTWFTPKRANREELATVRQRLGGVRACVELRSPRWFADDEVERTLAVLRDADLAYVVVDAPEASGLPTVLAATSSLAVVRFHGRNDENWEKRGITAAERFKYLYSRRELEDWVPKVAQLAEQAEEVHVLMNNCYQDFGVRNAADMADLLAS